MATAQAHYFITATELRLFPGLSFPSTLILSATVSSNFHLQKSNMPLFGLKLHCRHRPQRAYISHSFSGQLTLSGWELQGSILATWVRGVHAGRLPHPAQACTPSAVLLGVLPFKHSPHRCNSLTPGAQDRTLPLGHFRDAAGWELALPR